MFSLKISKQIQFKTWSNNLNLTYKADHDRGIPILAHTKIWIKYGKQINK